VFLKEVGVQKDMAITNDMMLKIKEISVSPTLITEQEVNQLRQFLVEHGSKRDYALVNLIIDAGLRISEALAIRLADFHNICQTKSLTITGFKLNKRRTVLLNDEIISIVKDYIANERNTYKCSSYSEFLFVSNKNRDLDRVTVNKMLKKYCYLAHLPNITPSQLRHFFISNALVRGFTISQVRDIVGHSNIHSTLQYMKGTNLAGICTKDGQSKMF